jgi:hypothetical protein
LKCNTCSNSYVGQTDRSLGIRHKEHTRYIKTNNPVSVYALHILTLILLTWRKWRAPNNASKQQMGFNSAFKELNNTGLETQNKP